MSMSGKTLTIKELIKKQNEEHKQALEKTKTGWVNQHLGPHFASFSTGFEYSPAEIMAKDQPKYNIDYLRQRAKELETIDQSYPVLYFGKDKTKAYQEAGFTNHEINAVLDRIEKDKQMEYELQLAKQKPTFSDSYLEKKSKELKEIDNYFCVKYLGFNKNKQIKNAGFNKELLHAIHEFKHPKTRFFTKKDNVEMKEIKKRHHQRSIKLEYEKTRLALKPK